MPISMMMTVMKSFNVCFVINMLMLMLMLISMVLLNKISYSVCLVVNMSIVNVDFNDDDDQRVFGGEFANGFN